MHWHTVGTCALLATTASAFRDVSPFFFFSTALDTTGSQRPLQQLSTAADVAANLRSRLSTCQSDAYIIVSQPGADAQQFQSGKAAPWLRQRMDLEGGEVKTSFKVASVIGAVDVAGIQEFLEKRCDAGFLEVDASTGTFDTVADMKPRVIRVDFAPLSKGPFDRTRQLRQNDAFLSSILDLLPTRKYTVMYTTTPSSSVDSSQYPGGSDTSYKHVAASPGEGDNELKRRTFVGARETNNTLIDGPLFERYQFFTPGIFMGLLIAFILLSILYAGLNGIASLKVSYAAFDKDMGPAAQKKAQ